MKVWISYKSNESHYKFWSKMAKRSVQGSVSQIAEYRIKKRNPRQRKLVGCGCWYMNNWTLIPAYHCHIIGSLSHKKESTPDRQITNGRQIRKVCFFLYTDADSGQCAGLVIDHRPLPTWLGKKGSRGERCWSDWNVTHTFLLYPLPNLFTNFHHIYLLCFRVSVSSHHLHDFLH